MTAESAVSRMDMEKDKVRAWIMPVHPYAYGPAVSMGRLSSARATCLEPGGCAEQRIDITNHRPCHRADFFTLAFAPIAALNRSARYTRPSTPMANILYG